MARKVLREIARSNVVLHRLSVQSVYFPLRVPFVEPLNCPRVLQCRRPHTLTATMVNSPGILSIFMLSSSRIALMYRPLRPIAVTISPMMWYRSRHWGKLCCSASANRS